MPPRDEWLTVLQSLDTASKGGPENDFSVCTTWVLTRGVRRWYLVDVWRKRVDYPALRAAVITLAAKHKARLVLVEDVGAGTSLVQELRGGKVSGSKAVKVGHDKISRMAVVSAKFEAGEVYLRHCAPWLADFERELFAFPGVKYDDQWDSVSQALSEQNYRLPMIISDAVLEDAGRPDPWLLSRGWRRCDLAPFVWKSVVEGKSYRVIADEFNETGVAPARQSKWTKHAVWRIASLTASEFGSLPEVVAVRRVGVAQLEVRQRVGEIGPLLLSWRDEGWSYQAIASELRRRDIKSPWGGDWGQASIGRYLKRAMAVSALKAASKASDERPPTSRLLPGIVGSKSDPVLVFWRRKTRFAFR